MIGTQWERFRKLFRSLFIFSFWTVIAPFFENTEKAKTSNIWKKLNIVWKLNCLLAYISEWWTVIISLLDLICEILVSWIFICRETSIPPIEVTRVTWMPVESVTACRICYWLYLTFNVLRNTWQFCCIFIQDRKDGRQGETINIFSVASGHL